MISKNPPKNQGRNKEQSENWSASPWTLLGRIRDHTHASLNLLLLFLPLICLRLFPRIIAHKSQNYAEIFT